MSNKTESLIDLQSSKPAPVGRPKLLTREEILDAAVELGLENLTMKQLATHLNVGAATLYQYFDNRSALVRAAAVRALSELSLPEDVGQHWSQYALDYAIVIRSILAENPTYIYNYQQTDYGLEVLFRLAETFLTVMKSKGFEPMDAMNVYQAANLAALSGAVEETRERAFAASGEQLSEAVKAHLADIDDCDLPLLRDAVDMYTRDAAAQMKNLLELTFQSIAVSRGEPAQSVFQPPSA